MATQTAEARRAGRGEPRVLSGAAGRGGVGSHKPTGLCG